MKPLELSLLLAVLPFASSCGTVQDASVKASSMTSASGEDEDEDEGEDADEQEEAVALERVPARVLEAARAAVPGVVLSSAEREVERGALHYCVHGAAAGELVEIEVSPDGDVLEIERGADEEDE